jgi:hypothetical protein
LERYFQRAHDEARRLLLDRPWLSRPHRTVSKAPRWEIAMVLSSGQCVCAYRDGDASTAVRSAMNGYGRLRPGVQGVARVMPSGLGRILDRAMADSDGSPTLSAGEGAEARRLLEMVAWDRVPQRSWPEVFDTLRMAAAVRGTGLHTWEVTLRRMLAEDGWLATAERSAA